MIRDPSDGSVREKPEEASKVRVPKSAVGIPATHPDTGLRQPTRTDAQERLERSREWLKQYHKPKDKAHAGGFSGEGSEDGDSGDDQGQAKR
jgi:hypothetical protein